MSRHKKFPLKILLFSIILLLIAIYVALRIFLPKYQKYVLEQPRTNISEDLSRIASQILHPYLGFVELPNQNADVNRFGFQGPEPIAKKSKDKVIVGITGGSFSLYYYYDERELLAEKLKTFPAFKNKKIEVYSIGLTGFKQPQQLMTLNYFLILGGQFDIVINIDGFNEVAQPYLANIPVGISTFYPLNWNLYSRRILDIKSNELVNSIQKHERDLEALKSFFSRPFFKNHFRLLQSVLYVYEQSQIVRLNNKLTEVLNNLDKNYQVTGPEIGSKEEREANMVNVWKEASIQMSKLAKENNILYLHFLQPNQYVPNSKTFTKTELKYIYSANLPYKEVGENFYQGLIDEGKSLRDSGVIFTDLTMVFKNVDRDIYIDECCHVNSFGNSILNDYVVQKIVENYK